MIDLESQQVVRLRVKAGDDEYVVDVPAPGLVPTKHIDNCTVTVLGLSEPKKLNGPGWSWEKVDGS